MGKKRRDTAGRRGRGDRSSSPPAAAGAGAARPVRSTAERVLSACGILLLFPALLPLVYVPGFLFPYISPKTLTFRSIGIVVLAALVYLLLARVPLRFDRLRQKVTWIPAALLAVEYVTSLAGIGFQQSFWSDFSRGDGLLTSSVAVLLFYAILLHADARFLRRLAWLSMAVASVVALHAIGQSMQGTVRPSSTLGNPGYMAGYLGMTLFLSLWLGREWRGWWRALAWASAGAQLLAIFLAGTRGTIVALGVAGIVVALRIAWSGQGRVRLAACLSVAATGGVIVLLLAFRAQLAQVPFAPLQRIAAISTTEGAAATRLLIWQELGRDALRRPLGGTGAEHVQDAFENIFQVDNLEEQNWFDRSHNSFLDYFVQFGVGGLLLYGALVVAGFAVARTSGTAGNYLLGLFATYAVQNAFVFDTAVTLWLFLAVLAAALALRESAPRQVAVPAMPRWIPVCVSVLLLGLLIPVAVQPARASVILFGVYSSEAGDTEEARRIRQGYSLNSYSNLEYGYITYEKYLGYRAGSLQGADLKQSYETVLDILTRNFRRYAYDLRTAVYLAVLLNRAPPDVSADLALANEAIDRAVRISPRRLLPWYLRVDIELRKGDTARTAQEKAAHYLDGINILKTYVDTQPPVADPRYTIARLYYAIGDEANARTWAQAGDAVYRGRASSAEKAADYYAAAGQWTRAAGFVEDHLKLLPAQPALLRQLASLKFRSGDIAGARAVADQLRAVSPRSLKEDPELKSILEAR